VVLSSHVASMGPASGVATRNHIRHDVERCHPVRPSPTQHSPDTYSLHPH
jgi:hypothetical protein